MWLWGVGKEKKTILCVGGLWSDFFKVANVQSSIFSQALI